MEITLLVAKVLGSYLVVSGLFLLLRGKTVPHLLKDFFGHPAFVYLTGAILLLLSTTYLLDNNTWDGTWRSVITVFMWLTFVKGVAYMLFPETLHKTISKKFAGTLNVYGVITVLAGLTLFYIA
jgi:hypothetical protein